MGMKLVDEKVIGVVSVYDMRNGEIAIITSSDHSDEIGYIIQRFDEDLLSLGFVGGSTCRTWRNVWKMPQRNPNFKVHLLPPGTQLKITNDS